MPYVYDNTQDEWPENDENFEPPAPAVGAFQYLPAPMMCGATEPVRFDQQGKLLSKPNPMLAAEYNMQAEYGLVAPAGEETFAVLLPVLRRAGAAQIYCRYDGGNDEGFAWISHAIANDGQKISVETLCDFIAKSPEFSAGLAAALAYPNDTRTEIEVIREALDFHLCAELWASWLLGSGYGTGEYQMYGAFIVDLVAGSVEDDPNAEAIVQNIEIASK